MNDSIQASYDDFPYQSLPFSQTHPDRLATLGLLFGAAPTPIQRCRVLEIGCASGGNLIPMSASLPEAEFVGIDLSPVQIAEGIEDIAATGIQNVRLLNLNVMDFGEDFGLFDYIIAHGVYSWVPRDVQDRLLALCAKHLSPSGIAYISYNTLPGWRMRGIVREAMQFHAQHIRDAKTRVAQARGMLDFLAESAKSDSSAYGVMLRESAEIVRNAPDYYVMHEHLEEVNDPIYFYQFMEKASRHGLRYLGDTDFASMLSSDFTPQVVETLSRIATDVIKREQFMDFLRNRTFRQTLLVREHVTLNRKLSPASVRALHVASLALPSQGPPSFHSNAMEEFRIPNGAGLKTANPITKAAMTILAGIRPTTIPFEEIYERANTLLNRERGAQEEDRHRLSFDVLQCFAAGVMELHSAPSPFTLAPGPKPVASAVARMQASRGDQVTNLRHERGVLDEQSRRLLCLLDGSNNREAIAAAAFKGVPAHEALQHLQHALLTFGRQALLVR
jgi:methyltransferase-like protein/2-polyprenyl-3-methyl-5-hydroxy-6-metoxy-1,4-benzoquinol methylase